MCTRRMKTCKMLMFSWCWLHQKQIKTNLQDCNLPGHVKKSGLVKKLHKYACNSKIRRPEKPKSNETRPCDHTVLFAYSHLTSHRSVRFMRRMCCSCTLAKRTLFRTMVAVRDAHINLDQILEVTDDTSMIECLRNAKHSDCPSADRVVLRTKNHIQPLRAATYSGKCNKDWISPWGSLAGSKKMTKNSMRCRIATGMMYSACT